MEAKVLYDDRPPEKFKPIRDLVPTESALSQTVRTWEVERTELMPVLTRTHTPWPVLSWREGVEMTRESC